MRFALLLLITSFVILDAQSHEHVTHLLQTVPCAQQHPYAITPYEWRELEIDTYIKKFDRTHTWCGSWGLQQLTRPITDYQALIKRQQGLKYFEQSPDEIYHWYKLLDALSLDQQHMFSYYNQQDLLAHKVKSLYFTWFSSVLNKSQVLLDYAYLSDVCSSALTLIGLLSINSLCAEVACAQMEGRSINFLQGALGGFSHLINAHSFNDDAYQKYKHEGDFNVVEPSVSATLSDDAGIWAMLSGKITGAVKGATQLLSKAASTQTMFKGTFGDKWSFYNEQCHIPSFIAACFVVGNTVYLDQCLLVRVNQHYRKLLSLFYTYRSLQHRLVGVARFMHNTIELLNCAQTVDALADNSIVQQAYALCTSAQSDLAPLITHLQSSNYDQEQNVWYSRGHALITHALINEHKKHLVHLLQAVGIIDAYVSLYRVYDEYKYTQNHFCFVDLVATSQPLCMFQGAWLSLAPLMSEQHSCVIGFNQPRNILLTGPNGSGKSYFLKLVGGLVVLAQSWTIVPALTCSMSVFADIRTSFSPGENIERGVSTFMAQKERLDQLTALVEKKEKGDFCMLLVDEPYRGTIEAEAEHRCYHWCNHMAQYAHCMQIVACHLKKPIELAHTDHFALKQLEVIVHDDVTFTRTFKLKDGVPHWWFDDVVKRMAFVDSI